MAATAIKVAIAEPSPIIRLGLEAQIKKLAPYKVQVIHLSDNKQQEWYEDSSLALTVDIFLLNPLLCGLKPQKAFANRHDKSRFVAISYGTTNEGLLSEYDGILNINYTTKQITELFDKLIGNKEQQALPLESQALTPREREIVVCVVKGMTNKAIAQALFLSTHTVITHRRNITKKLQIHSTSGLTIYAIMNKLVELDELSTDKKAKK